jgi:carbon storage regulator
MLILTRGVGEDICIGDDIVVKVNDIRGGRVRLGIQAPDHVSIDRREVAIRKQQTPSTRDATASESEPPCPM